MTLGHIQVRGAGLVVHAWGSEYGLACVHLGEVPSSATRRGAVPVPGIEIGELVKGLAGLAEAIEVYLAGRPLSWEGTLDRRGLSSFQEQVYDRVREVPYSEVRSYRDIARRIGRPEAVRAVGNALHRNPFPIVVPCHRIVREGGRLGGFACGVETKRRLLAIEAGQMAFDWKESA
jgi:O-6-methylguanine DNA methyltransferase